MKHVPTKMAAIALACSMTSNVAHAASIQRLTVEEIGVASDGLGTSTQQAIGGEARAYDTNGVLFTGQSFGFVSAGSTDGAIMMGSKQADGAFTLGFTQSGIYQGDLNTLRGAPSASVNNGVMTLDLSGLAGEFAGYSFSFAPDNNPVTAVSMFDANHYYYTADWSHVVQDGEVFVLTTGTTYLGFTGWTFEGHLEGIAAVPEAETYAMMMAGLSLVGLMAHRRRRLV